VKEWVRMRVEGLTRDSFFEYVGFPDAVEDDVCYWTGDDWEFAAGQAVRRWNG
jgi:hypothetical protein